MEEQQFEAMVERARAADAVVATLEPAVRSQAFAMLTDQTSTQGLGWGELSGLGLSTAGTDIAEVAFVVLMEATRDADEDSYHHVGLPVADAESGGVQLVPTDLYPGERVTTEDQLREIRDDLRDRLDSMSAVSEMTSLRLQMAMDRRSKLVETLSNIMKKIDETQETIVQNLKG